MHIQGVYRRDAHMIGRLRRFFAPPFFPDEERTQLAYPLNIILWSGLALVSAYIVASLFLPANPFLSLSVELGILAVHVICIALMHRGWPRSSALIYTISLWLLIFSATLLKSEITSTGVSSLYTVILIAGILLGSRGSFLLASLSTLGVTASVFIRSNADGQVMPASADWMPAIIVITNFMLVAVVAWLGRRSVLSSLHAEKSSRSLLSHRSAQLQAAAEIGTAEASTANLTTLIETITQVIADRFGFYHVSIMMIDPGTKELSLTPISQGGKKVEVHPIIRTKTSKERSIVAHAARTRKPYLAQDVKTDPLYLHDPQFEETKSELAIPIIVG